MTPTQLRSARHALGLNGPAFAAALGVAHSTIWRWETGRKPVPSGLTLDLARRLRDHGAECQRLALELLGDGGT